MADVRLIDANALLDRNNWTIKQYSEKEADAWRDGIALMKQNIENAPTIDAESLRPRGYWIRRKDRYDGAWSCSICGNAVGPVIALCSKYCLNCGAKMR